jgi:hypothetical protein
MVVAEPGYNERGTVSAMTSARKSKYKKKSTGNTSSRHASKLMTSILKPWQI